MRNNTRVLREGKEGRGGTKTRKERSGVKQAKQRGASQATNKHSRIHTAHRTIHTLTHTHTRKQKHKKRHEPHWGQKDKQRWVQIQEPVQADKTTHTKTRQKKEE